jgi:hypothetical protein
MDNTTKGYFKVLTGLFIFILLLTILLYILFNCSKRRFEEDHKVKVQSLELVQDLVLYDGSYIGGTQTASAVDFNSAAAQTAAASAPAV